MILNGVSKMINHYMLESSGKYRYVPKRNDGRSITCAMKDEDSHNNIYNVIWAVPCDGVIECGDGLDEFGCQSKFWLLPIILIGAGSFLYMTLVVYLHIQLKKRIREIIKPVQRENQQPVGNGKNKLIYIAILTEQQDIQNIQELVNIEIQRHGSFGKAMCCLKVVYWYIMLFISLF